MSVNQGPVLVSELAAAPIVDTQADRTETAHHHELKSQTPAPELAQTDTIVGSKVEFAQGEEPQNSLTENFTATEWKALKEFRQCVSQLLSSADPDNPNASTTPIGIWGVTIDPNNLLSARVSVVFMKFLRARNLNPAAAGEMFVATLRWRRFFNVEGAIKEEFPQDVFGQLGHIYGKDKAGRPVVYNIYGGNKDLKAVFGDVQRFLRWRVALMEKSIALLDFETVDQTIQVHDYEGVKLSSRDANSKQAASEATSIFQNHYPEFLHRKLFINVPTILNWIFWLFKPLINTNTLSKMSVVGTGHHVIKKALVEAVGEESLPRKYGGAEGF